MISMAARAVTLDTPISAVTRTQRAAQHPAV